MSDTEVERYEEGDELEEGGPRQQVRRMPGELPGEDVEVGPFYPSGMSAPEAALAGATADLNEDELAIVRGERVGANVNGGDVDDEDDEEA